MDTHTFCYRYQSLLGNTFLDSLIIENVQEIKSLDESIQRKKGDSYSDLSLNQNEYVHIKRPSAPNKTINNDISNKDSDDDGGGCYVF